MNKNARNFLLSHVSNRPVPISALDQAYLEAQFHIRQMPREILEKLNTIPTELTRFIQTLPSIQTLEKKRIQMIEHNRHLAINHLRKEPELTRLRQEMTRSFAELAPLREKYLKNIQSNNSKDLPSPDLVLGQLQSAAHANERLNDDMLETFFHTNHHNDSDLDKFVENFLRDRQETIRLRFIAEKFFDLYEIEKRKR